MRRGQLVAAYQTTQGICGFTRLASPGTMDSTNFNVFDLVAGTNAVRLKEPIPFAIIRRLPNAESNFDAVRFPKGTVHRVSADGLKQLLALAIAFNPLESRKLLRLMPK